MFVKKGFTLVEVVAAITIFLISLSTIYLIITRNIREQAEIEKLMDGLNYFKVKYYDLPYTEEYRSFSLEKLNSDDLFGRKEYLYEVKSGENTLISIYAIE
jgi:prepilin-type N-terminal cleavage/methylation domain